MGQQLKARTKRAARKRYMNRLKERATAAKNSK